MNQLQRLFRYEPLEPRHNRYVSAAEAVDPPVIRRLLVKQVTKMVRWRECVGYMKNSGVDTLIEIGTGKVLSGLTRRIDRDLSARSVQSPADIEALLKDL